jgi:hypothetical protein
MSLILSGTDGLSDIDGSAATPAIRGTDANTGMFFPAADTIAFAEGGVESMRIDSSGNVGIGTSSPAYKLDVSSATNTYLRAISTVASDAGWYFSNTARSWITFVNGADGAYRWYDATASAERARIPSTGGIQSVNSISVGNATPSASGAGITFPATQSASSDANTLDDYEEGTFTPTLVGFSTAGTTTYSTQTGLYTKIGRQVTYIVNLLITATTGTGAAVLGGFPFTFNSTVIPVAAMDASLLNWTGGTYLVVMPEGDTTTAFIFGEADDAARVTQNITNETQVIRFTLTHFV